MNRQENIAGDDRGPRRIASVLRALGDIARNVRARPLLSIALIILFRAEAVARDFVVGLAEDYGAPVTFLDRLDRTGHHQVDAIRLAARFRMLAAILDSLADPFFGQGETPWHTTHAATFIQRLRPMLPVIAAVVAARPAPALIDTS